MTTLSSRIRTAVEQNVRRCTDFATVGGMISGCRLLLEPSEDLATATEICAACVGKITR